MPRQRTKGERIQVQLPLDVDTSVRSRAARDGTSPSAVIVEVVTKATRKVAPISEFIPPIVVGQPLDCEHPKSRIEPVGSTGLKRCKSCGWTQGVDGVWRSGR